MTSGAKTTTCRMGRPKRRWLAHRSTERHRPMVTENFNRHAGALARAQNRAFELSTAGTTQGTFPCPRCGSTVNFTALIPYRSSGKCAARGCIRWSN